MRQKLPSIFITGGAGFIGSEFVRQSVAQGFRPVVVDKLTYAGNLKRLASVYNKIKFYKTDIASKSFLKKVFEKEKPDIVIHFAAETHVDRSIKNINPFVRTNIVGTQNLISLSRRYGIKKFIHISTDEVYGESKKGLFKETSRLNPRNPYSATKAAGDNLVQAAIATYQFPALIVRPANNYGPWQHPEKFIPTAIKRLLQNKKIPVYGLGRQIREWVYVGDCARAIHRVLSKGKIGEIYNVGSYFEQTNLKTAEDILKVLNKPSAFIQFVKDRPGHDFRYSVNCVKLRRLGWRPKVPFMEGLKKTVVWYKENEGLLH